MSTQVKVKGSTYNAKEVIDVFECEGCKDNIHIDDVVGRITYMNGLYGFWCLSCWSNR